LIRVFACLSNITSEEEILLSLISCAQGIPRMVEGGWLEAACRKKGVEVGLLYGAVLSVSSVSISSETSRNIPDLSRSDSVYLISGVVILLNMLRMSVREPVVSINMSSINRVHTMMCGIGRSIWFQVRVSINELAK